MLNQTSTTAIARTLLLAGILLAVTVLAARSFFPAFAQDENTINFDENSTSSVAVFSATDPEGEDIEWSLKSVSGEDEELFNIDGGELTFKNAPDYECPTDVAGSQCGGITNGGTRADLLTANTYTVTVVASAGTGTGTDTVREETLIVKVTNLDEPGQLELSTFQPKYAEPGVPIIVTLTDDDGSVSRAGIGDITINPRDNAFDPGTTNIIPLTWQWATSTDPDPTGTWHDIENATMASYEPQESDVNSYLRATVTYVDGSREDDPFTDDIDESMVSLPIVVPNKVLGKDYENSHPKFPDTDGDGDFNDPQVRTLKEDAAAGTDVGEEVDAEDKGRGGVVDEILLYQLSAGDSSGSLAPGDSTADDDDAYFDIDSSTGQITVDSDADLDFDEGQREYRVRVKAIDPDRADGTVDVTIKLVNVDEDPEIGAPTGTDNLSAKKIDEINSTVANALDTYNKRISQYTATDDEDDRDELLDDLKWSLSGSDASKFELCREMSAVTAIQANECTPSDEGETAELRLVDPPNFEQSGSKRNNYTFIVDLKVTDSDNDSATRRLTLSITNVDEQESVVLVFNDSANIPIVQPEVGTPIKAILNTPDLLDGSVSWEWATTIGSSFTSATVVGTGQTYTPVADDETSRIYGRLPPSLTTLKTLSKPDATLRLYFRSSRPMTLTIREATPIRLLRSQPGVRPGHKVKKG